MATSDAKRIVVKVFLYEIEPEIWRRFSISEASTMAQFHLAIQEVMGWEDKSEHEFRHGKGKMLNDVVASKEVLAELPKGIVGVDEATITIKEFLGRSKIPKRFMYRYDFSDDWVHEIVMEKRIEGSAGKPVLLGGDRSCPPEDCGGSFGYREIVSGEIECLDDDWRADNFDPKKVRFSA